MTNDKTIFVFGSNEGGHHGAGAAFIAAQHFGAAYGCGFGHIGNSFAIPTKDRTIRKTLPLRVISAYVHAFLMYAQARPDLTFKVTAIGCGLAGYSARDIAPLFAQSPTNCLFDTAWLDWMPAGTRYWGTF